MDEKCGGTAEEPGGGGPGVRGEAGTQTADEVGVFSKEDVVLAPEYEQRSGGILVVSPPGTCAIMAVITRVIERRDDGGERQLQIVIDR